VSPDEIGMLIEIFAKLAMVINAAVEASDDEQSKAAWMQAKGMFNKGFLAAYPLVMDVPVTGKMPTDE